MSILEKKRKTGIETQNLNYDQWLKETNGLAFYNSFKDPNHLESYLHLAQKGPTRNTTDFARAWLLRGIVDFFRPANSRHTFFHKGHYWARCSEDKWLPGIDDRTYRRLLDELAAKDLIIRKGIKLGWDTPMRRHVRPNFESLLTLHQEYMTNDSVLKVSHG